MEPLHPTAIATSKTNPRTAALDDSFELVGTRVRFASNSRDVKSGPGASALPLRPATHRSLVDDQCQRYALRDSRPVSCNHRAVSCRRRGSWATARGSARGAGSGGHPAAQSKECGKKENREKSGQRHAPAARPWDGEEEQSRGKQDCWGQFLAAA